MHTSPRNRLPALLLSLSLAAGRVLAADTAASADSPARIDYLTFAQGALPIRIDGGDAFRVNLTHAVQLIDGNPTPFGFATLAEPDTAIDFIYQLPAPTTFDRFAVPNVWETPSPSQTFTRRVEVYGSDAGADAAYQLLAAGDLLTHTGRGQETVLAIAAQLPVRWIKVRLIGGILIEREKMFFEFSELIGNGMQEPRPLSDRFNGAWRGRGVRIALRQDDAVVSGCYDRSGALDGTVSGNVLRARGMTSDDKVISLFVLVVDDDGALHGVRSTNGGPFSVYRGEPADGNVGAECATPPPPVLGCGAIIHAINFGFDSAEIQTGSAPVLAALFDGLQQAQATIIVIEGHTSSEGSTAYNLDLSERRARAVVADLLQRGMVADRIRAAGIGETRPLASNDDEAGRSLNRRVEVRCQ